MLNRFETAALKMFARTDRVDSAKVSDTRRRAFGTLETKALVTIQDGPSKWGSNPSKWGTPSPRHWRLTPAGCRMFDQMMKPAIANPGTAG